MLTLALIGLLGGLITAVSPCILPVLPVVFLAGGTDGGTAGEPSPAESAGRRATGTDPAGAVLLEAPSGAPRPPRNRRPYAVVAGLVLSFSFFTLLGVTIISALGLPEDILRLTGLALLILIGLGLVFPPVERLLEKPFSRIPQRQVNKEGSALVLGLGLGVLYVPCAGPVLAAITVAGARGEISADIVALTLSFAVGTAIPLLAFALAGRRIAARVAAFRTRARGLRITAGLLMIALGAALALDLTTALQRALPDYTAAAQRKVEDSGIARQKLSGLYDDSNKELSRCEDGADELRSCGQAPPLEGIDSWLNTPGNRPLDLKSLRGKVVLVDFWTYSCINCQRAAPYLRDWDRTYRDSGLRIIGVHSPEFVFEKKRGNVAEGARKLGVTWPVALDNDLTTWSNYRNRFWPAKYLIDAEGTVRYFKFGEGQYDRTETMIRDLLRRADPTVTLPEPTGRAGDDLTEDRTPETYLSTQRIRGYTGTPLVDGEPTAYRFPERPLPLNRISLDGIWTAGYEHFTAGPGARLALRYRARNANLVLAGTGTVTVLVDGKPVRTLTVSGAPALHRLTDHEKARTAHLELRFGTGLQAYALTFG
ncbi:MULTISPECIES: cytochrome c biogenesis protein DipZ [Streptomyces]|uniref:Thiol:disulfide interchange protein n=1 Tax=Streptomyces tsukubensis (strain DSM 42081 / NBRC 108919 / NRRL 18488 / 9993) TaxID=1114943 RepID=I2N823_STRT9|nr:MULTISPECIES: cytochrome c biogenesis protein CcdA [Streptomyces]AZK96999.1 thiol:disulfide interchange protein [Streptomyces tsukubensis]EIF93170.1 cytochrome C biogenesis protein DipZ [Streptomyces tsukubensis NRRL18488]MYS66565.1 redoxin domain-containing protein [Streptomyces sp. SID5473]QKM67021.1 thiol:disulfide interchange protein [Streptomyces tsukubensis NRRL18488]TAI41500.1 redoxin domain-containing protein [Streptomyces tsukubensis]